MDKSLLVYNRLASKGKLKHSLNEIEQALKNENILTDSVQTEHGGHGIELVENAVKEGYTRLIVVGGDGTVNECINGMVRAQKKGYGKTALGIIQNGRGNDFAYSAQIPEDLTAAIGMIKRDHRIPLDVGYVKIDGKERYFCNGTGLGFDSSINYYASRSKLTGFASYGYGLLKALFKDFKKVPANISWDGGEMNTKVLIMVAMNGKREGGGFILAPDFDLQDGKLDIAIVGGEKRLVKVLLLIPRFINGNIDHPDIISFKTNWVKAEFGGSGSHGQADGEILSTEGNEFYAEICPEKIDLIC